MEKAFMDEEYKSMQAKALEQLRSGQSLTGKDGALALLLKQLIEIVLAAEMAGHLDETERNNGNKLNGKGRIMLKTLTCNIVIDTSQKSQSPFSPEIVKKPYSPVVKVIKGWNKNKK